MTLSGKDLRPLSQNKRIVAIGSGKGGVGASMIATNLGVFLAQIGKSVILIDANLVDSGLYAWLGADRPKKSISDILMERTDNINDLVSETSVTGLFLLSGALDLSGNLYLTNENKNRLLDVFNELEADFILIDLPSGLDDFALDLFNWADASIVVSTATPDCVEATYRFFCAAWMKALQKQVIDDEVCTAILSEMRVRSGRPPTPREIVKELKDLGSESAKKAQILASTFRPQLIINQTRIREDEELGDAMVSASARWLGIMPCLLGSVGWDENVWLSLRRQKLLLIEFARSRVCKDLERLVRNMLSQKNKDLYSPRRVPPSIEKQNYYELLEIYPGASEEEVRRAFKQIKSWFGINGMAIYGICTDTDREDFQKRAEEAHGKLIDRSKRRQYDIAKFPNGFHSAREPEQERERESIVGTIAATHESLPKVVVTNDQFVDGKFLGEIRRQRNVELIDISNRAKISVAYLKAIETEEFEHLPAAVFTRGFVTEFARFLKIDPLRATRDFMAKYEAFENQKVK